MADNDEKRRATSESAPYLQQPLSNAAAPMSWELEGVRKAQEAAGTLQNQTNSPPPPQPAPVEFGGLFRRRRKRAAKTSQPRSERPCTWTDPQHDERLGPEIEQGAGLRRALDWETEQRIAQTERERQARENQQDLRLELTAVAEAQDRRSSEKAVSEPPPPQTADNAVRAFILLFALGFVLRGIDIMDHDIMDAIQKWVIAAGISIIDYFYVPIRTALGPRFSSTAAKVATDFRWWAAAILVLLVWAVVEPAVEKHGLPWAKQSIEAKTGPSSNSLPKPLLVANPSIAWNGGAGPIIFNGLYARTGGRIDIYIEYGQLLGSAPVAGVYINWDGRRFPVDSKDRAVRDAEIKTTIGTVSEVGGNQLVLQLGKEDFKIGITNASYVFRLFFIPQEGEEQSYLFALISSRSVEGKSLPAIIVDPNTFLGVGNK